MKLQILLLSACALLPACSSSDIDFDATGTFEATETTIFAEQSGQILFLGIEEGDNVEQGMEIARIDSSQTFLMILQLEATRASLQSQKPDTKKQIAATRDQIAKAEKEKKRYEQLVADGAVSTKSLDDIESQLEVLQSQLEAQLSSLDKSTDALDKQMKSVDAQIAQSKDMLRKCHVKAPANGTVLEKYAELGEFVSIGKPIAKTADIADMYIRAYVTSSQLKDIKLGQEATVYCDFGDEERRSYSGVVTWISARSEFTPKTILTDDERADLVYAIKVRFANDGYVKIGMYGEVKF